MGASVLVRNQLVDRRASCGSLGPRAVLTTSIAPALHSDTCDKAEDALTVVRHSLSPVDM